MCVCDMLCPHSSRARFWRTFCKRLVKMQRNFGDFFFPDFRPSISREMAANIFTENPRHFPLCANKLFLIAPTLGAEGPKIWLGRPFWKQVKMAPYSERSLRCRWTRRVCSVSEKAKLGGGLSKRPVLSGGV